MAAAPPAGGPVRIVVTGDNHLGRHYDRMAPQRLEERRARLRRGFVAAVDHALQQRAHFFLHAGDLFDTVDPRNVERDAVAVQLARLRAAGVVCLAIAGNHDTPRMRLIQGGYPPQSSLARLGGLTLFDHRVPITPVAFDVPPDGPAQGARTAAPPGGAVRVAIGGLTPDPAADPDRDPLEGIVWPEVSATADAFGAASVPLSADAVRRAGGGGGAAQRVPGVLLLHQSVEGHVFPGVREPVVAQASLAAAGADVCLIGHVHAPAQFAAGKAQVIVPGATERMAFGDSDRTGFVYVELDAAGRIRSSFVTVPNQPRVQVAVGSADLAAAEQTGTAPLDFLRQRIDAVAGPESFVRLRLEGPVSRAGYHALRLRELGEYGAGRCFFFDLDPHGLYLEGQEAFVRGPRRLSQQAEIQAYVRERADALDPDDPRTPHERGLWHATEQLLLARYGAPTGEGDAE